MLVISGAVETSLFHRERLYLLLHYLYGTYLAHALSKGLPQSPTNWVGVGIVSSQTASLGTVHGAIMEAHGKRRKRKLEPDTDSVDGDNDAESVSDSGRTTETEPTFAVGGMRTF